MLGSLSLELLKGHVLECCLDKTCAKFIQEKLTSNLTRSERTCFLDELFAIDTNRFEELVTDCFGNYIIQKALLLPNLEHKYQDAAFQQIRGKIFILSTDKHGCRVIQTCVGVFTFQKKTEIIKELIEMRYVKDCCFDFNGNHVIQRLILELAPIPRLPLMETLFKGIEESIIDFSIHEYSCRIVQRMLESCHQSYLTNCINILLDNFYFLTQKEFGIFVLSAMLQHCQDDVREKMLSNLQGRCGAMSLMKDGSKLIENAIRLLENKQAA